VLKRQPMWPCGLQPPAEVTKPVSRTGTLASVPPRAASHL
jgi:hypothetical protein